jgi:hypothetical protein
MRILPMKTLTKKIKGGVNFILAAALALGLAAGVTTLLAVHLDNLFELDGNAVDDPAVLGDDWSSVLCTGSGTPAEPFDCIPPFTPPGPIGGNSGATTGLVIDPIGDDETTHFKGGDKDTQDIPDWDVVSQNDTPKDDIEHAYAAAYTAADGDLIIYAGDDRFATAGTASHGFWFFKNKITQNGSKFDGVHADGDILVTVEFQQGGTEAVINVFRWETQPVGNDPNLQLLFSGETNVTPGVPFCNPQQGSPGDPDFIPADVVCGVTNAGTVASPWDYVSSSAGAGVTDEDFPPQSFFELGINITELTGGTCFASFLASSRSSASEQATIKDFVLSGFPLCGVEVTKTCVPPATVVEENKLRTTFHVDITSVGSGTIHNVKLAEMALGTGEECRITAVGTPPGAVSAIDPASLPVDFVGTTPVEVYTSLAGNTTATVTVECDTINRNPFDDHVDVTAGSSPGLSDLEDPDGSDTTNPNDCFIGAPNVIVEKCCQSVTIDPDNFTPEVCVAIKLTNNSVPAEALENITVVDNRDGVLVTVLSGGTLAASGEGASLILTDLCYTPTSADQTGDPVDPDDITFSDHIESVTGTGSATGEDFSITTVPPLPSATCPLCPPQPECGFTIPALSVQQTTSGVSASTEAAAPTHTLKVENGRGSGRYEAGKSVKVTADPPPPGKKFAGWSGDIQILANPFLSTTSATAVSKDVKIKANYADK